MKSYEELKTLCRFIAITLRSQSNKKDKLKIFVSIYFENGKKKYSIRVNELWNRRNDLSLIAVYMIIKEYSLITTRQSNGLMHPILSQDIQWPFGQGHSYKFGYNKFDTLDDSANDIFKQSNLINYCEDLIKLERGDFV